MKRITRFKCEWYLLYDTYTMNLFLQTHLIKCPILRFSARSRNCFLKLLVRNSRERAVLSRSRFLLFIFFFFHFFFVFVYLITELFCFAEIVPDYDLCDDSSHHSHYYSGCQFKLVKVTREEANTRRKNTRKRLR